MALSHLDDKGNPGMVDVGDKDVTDRTAEAACRVVLGETIMATLEADDFQTKKGSVIQTAIIAGTMAVKQTWSVIPLCHPLDVSGVKFFISSTPFVGAAAGASKGTSGPATTGPNSKELYVRCRVRTRGRTGVEMEALHGASVAALTIYDMCKAMSQEIRIEGLRLVLKTGGKTDLSLS